MVLRIAGGDDSPIRAYQICRKQVVDGQPMRSLEISETAAEHQAPDPRCRDNAAGGRKTVGVRRVVEIAPGGATTYACASSR